MFVRQKNGSTFRFARLSEPTTNHQPKPEEVTAHPKEVFALCAANAHEADGGDGAAIFLLGSMAEHSCRWVDLVGRERSWDKMTSSSGGLQEGHHGKGS